MMLVPGFHFSVFGQSIWERLSGKEAKGPAMIEKMTGKGRKGRESGKKLTE
jgi:hypothetical protein